MTDRGIIRGAIGTAIQVISHSWPPEGRPLSRFKGENGSLFYDAANIWELTRAVGTQVDYYKEAFGLSACEYAQAGAGTPGAAAYINREVSLPKPVLDLAPLST